MGHYLKNKLPQSVEFPLHMEACDSLSCLAHFFMGSTSSLVGRVPDSLSKWIMLSYSKFMVLLIKYRNILNYLVKVQVL